jgi:hypothetical protein
VISFSLLINHAPWSTERKPRLRLMQQRLLPDPDDGSLPFYVHDIDYRFGMATPKSDPVDFTLNQWRWCARQDVSHHVLMTDDIDTCPRFWSVIEAIVTARPNSVIGLLSNHPEAPRLRTEGVRWYRTNSWVVGPAYIVPHAMMVKLLAWSEARTPAGSVDKLGWSDDSELNEWITFHGPREAWHPIPTPISHHRGPSTWSHTGHGDNYSHERVKWDDNEVIGKWPTMRDPQFWLAHKPAPMLGLPR